MKGRDVMTLFLFFYPSILLMNLIQEVSDTDFNDLGKLLLGGVAVAIAFAVAFTFVRLRLRDKKPPASTFISITDLQNEERIERTRS